VNGIGCKRGLIIAKKLTHARKMAGQEKAKKTRPEPRLDDLIYKYPKQQEGKIISDIFILYRFIHHEKRNPQGRGLLDFEAIVESERQN
jgi:hypothetical protein